MRPSYITCQLCYVVSEFRTHSPGSAWTIIIWVRLQQPIMQRTQYTACSVKAYSTISRVPADLCGRRLGLSGPAAARLADPFGGQRQVAGRLLQGRRRGPPAGTAAGQLALLRDGAQRVLHQAGRQEPAGSRHGAAAGAGSLAGYTVSNGVTRGSHGVTRRDTCTGHAWRRAADGPPRPGVPRRWTASAAPRRAERETAAPATANLSAPGGQMPKRRAVRCIMNV